MIVQCVELSNCRTAYGYLKTSLEVMKKVSSQLSSCVGSCHLLYREILSIRQHNSVSYPPEGAVDPSLPLPSSPPCHVPSLPSLHNTVVRIHLKSPIFQTTLRITDAMVGSEWLLCVMLDKAPLFIRKLAWPIILPSHSVVNRSSGIIMPVVSFKSFSLGRQVIPPC